MENAGSTCYLCGHPVLAGQPADRDHVPPRQVFPSSIREGLTLLTLPVHKKCHGTTGRDEEYFLQHVLFPLAHSTPTGQAAIPDFQAAVRREAGWNKAQRVRTEFDARPSGLVLPDDKMVKHFDPEPVSQTIWKITRGLFFDDTERFLPKDTPRAFEVFTEGEQDLPPLTVALMGEPSRGHSPEVFDYKMRLRDEPLTPHFMLMRFWEKLIWQVAFHDPGDPPAIRDNRQPGAAMTVRRGVHRLFGVACGLWVVFVMVGIPLLEVRARNEAYALMLKASLDDRRSLSFDDVYNSPTLISMRQNGNIQAVYRDHLPEWPWVLAFIFIPPVVVYGVVAAVVRVVRWIVHGFRS